MVEEWRGRNPWAVWGGSTMVTPAMSPSRVFAYKNTGRGRPKKGECTEAEEENKKKKQIERETTREEREHKRGEREERRVEKVREIERGTKLKERRRTEEKKTEE